MYVVHVVVYSVLRLRVLSATESILQIIFGSVCPNLGVYIRRAFMKIFLIVFLFAFPCLYVVLSCIFPFSHSFSFSFFELFFLSFGLLSVFVLNWRI